MEIKTLTYLNGYPHVVAIIDYVHNRIIIEENFGGKNLTEFFIDIKNKFEKCENRKDDSIELGEL